MNPDAPLLARDTFLQAAQPGPPREPAAVAAMLAKLEAQADGGHVDVGELEEALDAEFPWRNQLVFHSRQPQREEFEAWIQVVRWLLQSLLAADVSAKGSARQLQVLLTALGTLDVGNEGLSAVSCRFAGSHVLTSIVSMLQTLEKVPKGLDARSEKWLRELPGEVNAGNFKMLQNVQRVIQPLFRSDVRTSVFLLRKLEPVALASLINSRSSILFDLLVCGVLDADAPLFALQVESVAFKFVSLSWLDRMERICPEVDALDVLKQMLLQVAKTPHWKGWLQATYEYPSAGSEHSRALAEALAQLAEPQWSDFVFALSLSTSRGSAEAVADILRHVADKLGSAKARPIWSVAFERWNAWDYGRWEERFHLSSPQVCAFDFPVAMYYSHVPAAERDALERELQDAILHVEQRWFSSESELCSERNRLASRLRLVRHGSALAAGDVDALPAPVQPDSEYAEVRYRYHDVNSTLARTMRR